MAKIMASVVDGREKIFHANLLKPYVTCGEASVGAQNHKLEPDMQDAKSAGGGCVTASKEC